MSALKTSLYHLPVIVGKVQLWLTYRDLKPLSTIVLDFEWEQEKSKQQELKKWLDEAGLKYMLSQKTPTALHISKEQIFLDQNHQFELDETQAAHELRGKLYGFPEEATSAFSKTISEGGHPFTSSVLIHPAKADTLENLYWFPYIEYILRREHLLEDSEVAKGWADLIRNEVPQLAAEYEEQRRADLKKVK